MLGEKISPGRELVLGQNSEWPNTGAQKKGLKHAVIQGFFGGVYSRGMTAQERDVN